MHLTNLTVDSLDQLTQDNHVDKQLIAGEDHFPRPSSSFSSNTSGATLGGASGSDRDTDHLTGVCVWSVQRTHNQTQ